MKFYIISIILNIIALFVPIAYYTSGGGGKVTEQDEIVIQEYSRRQVKFLSHRKK